MCFTCGEWVWSPLMPQLGEFQFRRGQIPKASIEVLITVNLIDRQSHEDKNKRCFIIQELNMLGVTSVCDCEGLIVFWGHRQQDPRPFLAGSSGASMNPRSSSASMHFPESPEDVTPHLCSYRRNLPLWSCVDLERFLKSLTVQFIHPHQPTLKVVASSEFWPSRMSRWRGSGLCILWISVMPALRHDGNLTKAGQ